MKTVSVPTLKEVEVTTCGICGKDVGYLRTFFSRWPYSFVGKTEDVIRKEMDEDIAKMVSSIQTDITRKIGETIDLSYYDAMQALIESGKTPDEIISLVS